MPAAMRRRGAVAAPAKSAPEPAPPRAEPGVAWWLDATASFYVLFAAPLADSGLLTTLPGRASLALCLLVLAYKLLVFRRWGDETRPAARFFTAFALLLFQLSVENCLIWAVSASDQQKAFLTPALQDNVLLGYQQLRAALPPRPQALLDAALQHEYVGIKEKLMAFLLLAFAAVFDGLPRSGFAVGTHFVLTVASARAIRTVAFCLTVLPNPRPGCYARRFPPVPATVADFLRVGFAKMRSGGGCNDLVLSGHGVIYAACACAWQRYAPGSLTARLLWLALARSSLRAVVTAQHYSVDMFLATTVTWLCWRACEPHGAPLLVPRKPGSPADPRGPLQVLLTASLFAMLAVLAAIILIGGA